MLIGLTGGVGSGKSTVAAMLADHGAVVIDADVIAREVVEPGQRAYHAVVERFGPDVVLPGGELDRAALAQIVFHDEAALADLNAIVHPAVGERSAELIAAAAGAIVVYDVPLLAESQADAAAQVRQTGTARSQRRSYDVIVVVQAALTVRLDRLEGRGMDRADAAARIAAQASDEQRRAIADEVLDNSGTVAELGVQVDDLWQRLVARAT